MRAALQDLARNPDVGLTWIVARLLGGVARICRDAAYLPPAGLVFRRIPISGPLPDVADHVMDAEAVRWKRGHRRGTLVPVCAEVLRGEITLPSVCKMLPAGRELRTPSEFGTVEAATGREFPLRLGRQLLASPLRIRQCVAIGDVDDRMIAEFGSRAAWTVWPAPIGTELELPPLLPAAQID